MYFKINHLCVRHLCFESVRGDLLEGKRLRDYVLTPIYEASTSLFRFPMPFSTLLEHKNADFVLGRCQNLGKVDQKRTKSPFLCSKGLKMRVFEGKSAQKC